MVLSIVALIGAGLEAFSDFGRGSEIGVPPIITVMDALTPVSPLITGFLAGVILWSGPRSSNVSEDLLVILVAFLITVASITATIALARYLHFLNGGRPIPWYRFILSIILFCGMSWAAWRNILENRKAEQCVGE